MPLVLVKKYVSAVVPVGCDGSRVPFERIEPAPFKLTPCLARQAGRMQQLLESLFGGDVAVSGSSIALGGLSGSLTRLVDGTSYLISDTDITITTALVVVRVGRGIGIKFV